MAGFNSFKSVKCSYTNRATAPQRYRHECRMTNVNMTLCTHNPKHLCNFSLLTCISTSIKLQNGKKVNNRRKRGWLNLISFGVSSSSYFFFSFFRKTSHMINMTMRTPRDIPTTAPATIPTSLTSVNGEEGSDEWWEIESLTVTYYSSFTNTWSMLVDWKHLNTPYICATVSKFNLTPNSFCWATACVNFSTYDPDRPGPLRKCISVTVKHNCWSRGGDQ